MKTVLIADDEPLARLGDHPVVRMPLQLLPDTHSSQRLVVGDENSLHQASGSLMVTTEPPPPLRTSESSARPP